MLTSKQRSYLRGLANNINSIFQVGKNGIADNFIKQIEEALEARELIKVNVLNNAFCETKEIASEIATNSGAELVQVIGSKIVLYKESKENKKIILPPK
jgi:RNA-binding protein